MKKSNLLQSLFVAFLLVFTTLSAHAKLLLNDNFAYNATTLLNNGTWVAYGSNPNAPIQLVTPALTYQGYQTEAAGKSVSLGKESLAEDAQTIFSGAITEGNLYYAALINLTEAPTEKAGTIMAFLQPGYSGALEVGKTGTEFALLSALQTADGQYKLQVSRNNTTVAATEQSYNYGTTYLVVVKYTFVEGTTNDEVRLYVNPSIDAEPATADALYNTASGSDINTSRGILGIELCQAQSGSKNASVLTLDAIRVATTWAELFNQTAGGGDQDPVPAISVNTTSIEFEGTMFVGGPAVTKTVNVKATDLTADITITTTSTNLTVEPATITKEAAMSEAGADVVVTFTPNSIETGFPNVVFASEGAKEVKVPVSAYVVEAVANLGAMIEKAKVDGYYYGAISGEIAVSQAFQQSGQQCLYIQDATAAFLVYDSYEILGDLKAGDRFTGASVYYAEGDLYFETIGTKGENAPVEPEIVSLAELTSNAARYAFRLVRVNDITFSQTGDFAFGTQYDIAQGEAVAKLSLFAESDIIGTQLPSKADVIGIVRNATGKLISPRTTADIIAKTAKPTLMVNRTNIDFGETIFYVGGPSAQTTLTVKGSDLTEDITITSSSANLSVEPATVSKADAMSESGAEITLTFTPLAVEYNDPYITIRSEGATQVQVVIAAFVNDAVANLGAMKDKIATEGFFMGFITGEIAITHAYEQNGVSYFYVQDATAGLIMNSELEGTQDWQAGDRLTNIGAYYEGGSIFSLAVIGNKGENAPVEPEEVTLAEIDANKDKYAFRLVRINDITFSQTGDFAFGTQYDIAQGEAVAKLSLFAESDIIGTQLPNKADVIGIVRNATGKLISPRTTEDIIDKSINTSLADAYAAQVYTETGMLCIVSEAETAVSVYTMLGAEIATVRATTGTTRIALEQGIYIVRINGKATKVIVK